MVELQLLCLLCSLAWWGYCLSLLTLLFSLPEFLALEFLVETQLAAHTHPLFSHPLVALVVTVPLHDGELFEIFVNAPGDFFQIKTVTLGGGKHRTNLATHDLHPFVLL